MKKLSMLTVSVLALGLVLHAQCGREITWQSAKTDYLDAAGNLRESKAQHVVAQTTAKHVIFSYGDTEDEKVQGDVKDLVCDWKEPFAAGKIQFRSVLFKSNGESRDAVVTIEMSEGGNTILVDIGDKGKLKIYVDKFQVNN